MTAGAEFRVDCHVKVLNRDVVANARAAGLDAIIYAPHFTRLPEIRRRAEVYSSEDLLVIPAREVFTGSWKNRKHVLALGLSDPVPDFISLEAAMAEFERQDATVLIPHPEFLTVSLGEDDIRAYEGTIDALEIYNPKHLPRDNRRAREISESYSIPPFTSSYAHVASTVGAAYTAFDGDFETESDVLAALENRAGRRVVHTDGPQRWATTAKELAHLGYENTWQKIDRLFLSGQEPTHANHIAYDGRFEDDAVY
ncbi:metal-dependent phosphoesterase [Halostagnicola larsenii XH-48]|uniref:Metal-dependent phosphoesterase n=1 Tax=Halostagnicola larsenii XH-48 TaxID=797299 RepID=W0JM71_9EURY|nr:metal-dependent phosphoesterase [Halostagnicola larsenii XH-48]